MYSENKTIENIIKIIVLFSLNKIITYKDYVKTTDTPNTKEKNIFFYKISSNKGTWKDKDAQPNKYYL